MASSSPTIIDAPEETTAPAAAPPSEPIAPRVEVYVPIRPGDTLEDIAERYQTDVQTIVERNKINPDWYTANQWIFV